MYRGFAAATLELSQFANEEGKAKALAAATRELDRLFKKEDFNHMKVLMPVCYKVFVKSLFNAIAPLMLV